MDGSYEILSTADSLVGVDIMRLYEALESYCIISFAALSDESLLSSGANFSDWVFTLRYCLEYFGLIKLCYLLVLYVEFKLIDISLVSIVLLFSLFFAGYELIIWVGVFLVTLVLDKFVSEVYYVLYFDSRITFDSFNLLLYFYFYFYFYFSFCFYFSWTFYFRCLFLSYLYSYLANFFAYFSAIFILVPFFYSKYWFVQWSINFL